MSPYQSRCYKPLSWTNTWVFMLYYDLGKKTLADNTVFEFDGRTSLSSGCVYAIMIYSVLQTPASVSTSENSNVFRLLAAQLYIYRRFTGKLNWFKNKGYSLQDVTIYLFLIWCWKQFLSVFSFKTVLWCGTGQTIEQAMYLPSVSWFSDSSPAGWS